MNEKSMNEKDMTEKVNEQISALVDGELGSEEQEFLIRRLAQDETLQGKWDRYHLISNVMQNHLSGTLDVNMATKVGQAVDQEDVLQLNSQGGVKKKLARSVAGLSIAASVAVFSIIGIQQYNMQTTDVTAPDNQVASSEATTIEAADLEVIAETDIETTTSDVSKPDVMPVYAVYAKASGTRWNIEQPKVGSRLNSYLVNHNEYASATNLQGMVHYAKIAGYDAE